MASLFSRPNGIYSAEFYNANKTPRSKRFSLKTRKQRKAVARLAQLQADYGAGLFDPWMDDPWSYNQSRKGKHSLNVGQALDAFIADKEAKRRSKAPIINYKSFCGGLVRMRGANKPLGSITAALVERYIYSGGVCDETRRTRYRHVRAWLRWCEKKGYVKGSAIKEVTPPAAGEKMPKAVREADMKEIEAAIRADYADKRQRGEALEGQLVWMIPMLWFGLYSRLRSSELARLRWGHIDFERNLVHVLVQKNGRQQTIPLTAPARRILEQMPQDAPEAFVFASAGSDRFERDVDCFKRNVARKFKRYRKDAGIDRRITPHGLRHGFCTILAEGGKSAPIIKEAARHADISTAMRYVHIANEKLKAELDGVFR